MPKITQYEILQTIRYLQNRIALGTDQIPNKVFKIIAYKIYSCLKQVFNDLLVLGHYFSYFKELIVVILYKTRGNYDYTNPKSYQPISLLNILGKILKAILATRISYMATSYNFLPRRHFGGRQRPCIEIAIHNFLEKIDVA